MAENYEYCAWNELLALFLTRFVVESKRHRNYHRRVITLERENVSRLLSLSPTTPAEVKCCMSEKLVHDVWLLTFFSPLSSFAPLVIDSSAFYSWKRLLYKIHFQSHIFTERLCSKWNQRMSESCLTSFDRPISSQTMAADSPASGSTSNLIPASIFLQSWLKCQELYGVRATIFNKTLDSNPFVRRCVVENLFLCEGEILFSKKTLFHRSQRAAKSSNMLNA